MIHISKMRIGLPYKVGETDASRFKRDGSYCWVSTNTDLIVYIVYIYIYEGFPKYRYPPIIHFNGIFPNKKHPFLGTSILGNPHIYIYIYR